MGGKGKDKGSSGGGKAPAETDERKDPATFLKNYSTACKALEIAEDTSVLDLFKAEEPPVHISIDAELGPEGTKALVEGITGEGPNSSQKAYILINTLRLWKSNIEVGGCESIAHLLRVCGSLEIPLSYLQLLDCKIRSEECKILSSSLHTSISQSLVTLNMDYNAEMGADGLKQLTVGLCTNSTIQNLSLKYCNITAEGGRSIKSILNGYSTKLENLCLKGNPLQGEGLAAFGKALAKNKVLKVLDMRDTDIGSGETGLKALCDAIKENTTLGELYFDQNHIGTNGAKYLIESGAFEKGVNASLKVFQVDYDMTSEQFTTLNRNAGGGKKGKKGKGKKK